CKRTTDKCIHAPDMKTPVIAGLRNTLVNRFAINFRSLTSGLLQSINGFLLRRCCVWRRVNEVGQWFGRPIEKQSYAEACTEHHCNPREARELGFLLVFSKSDFAVFAERHVQHDKQTYPHGGVEQPAH